MQYRDTQRLLGCKVHWRSKVLRPDGWCGKWCVPYNEYRDLYYPAYCWGTFYVMSSDLVRLVAAAVKVIPPWWVADVYLTGIVPKVLASEVTIERVVLNEYLEEDGTRLMQRLALPGGGSVVFGLVRSIQESMNAWTTLQKTLGMVDTATEPVRYFPTVR